MAKTLYVSDLDGTLLNSESQVSTRSAHLISELTSQGALISVATARTPASVVPIMNHALTTPPLIVMTGAALWLRDQQAFANPVFIQPLLLDHLLTTLAEYNIQPFIYALDNNDNFLHVYHPVEMNHKENQFYQQRRALPLKKFHIGDNLPPRLRSKVLLLYTTGPADAIYEAASRLNTPEFPCSVSAYPDIFDPATALIEIFAPEVSKAIAVKQLQESLGADRLVVFGDNLNDISMMKVADVAVAVDNAQPEVKQNADVVIAGNDFDSVARYISADFNA
ncbi:MAG: HAD family hydrolase [Muribaculaceae bacterium]|nr:HAD family hydrolase [Muribaculaceae bacterium]